MNVRILALGGLMLCACFAASVRAQTGAPPRTVSVNGSGEVRVEPDRASVVLGAEARKLKLEEARAEVARTVEAVLKLTREMKIDQNLVRATRISVQPEYNWDQHARERTLIGYYVARQVEIELHDLDKLGTLLERAADLGVNQMGDPQLDSSRRAELVRDALAKAVADARRNAEVVAKAAGAKLGPARTISANSGHSPPPVPLMRASLAVAEKAADTYQSGEMSFNAQVNIQYDLIPEGQP